MFGIDMPPRSRRLRPARRFFLFDTALKEAFPLSKNFYVLDNLHIRKRFNKALYAPEKFNLLHDEMQLIQIDHASSKSLSMICADHMRSRLTLRPVRCPVMQRVQSTEV